MCNGDKLHIILQPHWLSSDLKRVHPCIDITNMTDIALLSQQQEVDMGGYTYWNLITRAANDRSISFNNHKEGPYKSHKGWAGWLA